MYLMRQVKEKRPGIPIIVMSGYATSETIKEAKDLGAATFLSKPFTPDELADTIKTVLANVRRG
jgi:DNA-binding NtrC family response regulator